MDGGYFRSRCRGYGQEHVERTRRMLPTFKPLKSSITVTSPISFSDQPDRDRNGVQWRELLFGGTYRAGGSGGGWMTAVWQRDH